MAAIPRYFMTDEELALLTQQTVTRILESIDQDKCFKVSPGVLGLPPNVVRTYLRRRGVNYSPRIIAHMNLKGGTGKTTTTVTSATRAVQYGFRTCIIDLDPQGAASLAFHASPKEDDLILRDVWEQPTERTISALKKLNEFLYILPSSVDNDKLNIEWAQLEIQKQAVKGVCKMLKAKGFDLIMIDCPPSLGAAVISTICAANAVVIPVCNDAYSRRGVVLTLKQIASICQRFNRPLPQAHILYTRFDKRVKMATQVLNMLVNTYKRLFIPTPIRNSSEFAKALEKRETVFASARKSPAKDDYDQYVRYLLKLDDALQNGQNSA
jgi:chromosome partitioning protein